MGKRNLLDSDFGQLNVVHNDMVTQFFCYRCNRKRKAKITVFWGTAQGRKTICHACYLELMRKREKTTKKPKKQKPDEPEQLPDQDVLCPFLLEKEQDEASVLTADQFLELMHQHLKKQSTNHYFSALKVRGS